MGEARVFRGVGAARILVVIVIAALASLGFAACGGGSSSASKEEIAQAERRGEKRGRRDRMEKEKERTLEAEVKELKKLANGSGGSNAPHPPPTTAEAAPAAPAPESERSSCGGSLSVGPDTSCPFAENVRYEYENEIGAGEGTVYAFSPANNEIYEMFCTGAPHECTGAISATVYFP
jgi:hypothetical protein